MNKFLSTISFLLIAFAAFAQPDKLDSEGYPEFYVRGVMTQSWSVQNDFHFTRNGDTFTLSLASLDGEFKISGTEWQINFGSPIDAGGKLTINDAATFYGTPDGQNLVASNLKDVTITFKYAKNSGTPLTPIYISANGHEAPALGQQNQDGPLPVLHINVYREGTREFDNEVISRNLDHKNYFSGEYWLDLNGCEWAEELGASDIGSEEEPLPLEIKARGNFTRIAFAKKPFKLKLGKKQSLLGMSKSKHYAILAHADDNYGYLRNFTGFNLGKRIGLPWTPSQQPVEVYINGDYRGLYFLTESIRIEEGRIDITGLADGETDNTLISGGYLVELDNYDEENQIRMAEKTFVGGYTDVLRITMDTPEVYSDIQRQFVTDQFTAMNNYVGSNNDLLWSYLDLDDAVRYYIVEEILSHTESYHGSTYLFRDYGADQKWHFSPLWDCGNAFNGRTDCFFYQCDPYGNTWIESIRQNNKFNERLKETWAWFMQSRYPGLEDDINEYVESIRYAALRDRERWKNAPAPSNYEYPMSVVDNSDMNRRKNDALWHLNTKTGWLKSQFGDYTAMAPVDEPARDTTPAAALPDYVGLATVVDLVGADFSLEEAVYYTLDGIRVQTPVSGRIYIVVTPAGSRKVKF